MSVKVREIRPGKWGLRIDHDGSRRTITIGSKPAAEKARLQLEIEIAKKKLGISPIAPPKTFKQVATEWLEFVKVSRSRGTYTRYRGIVKMHLTPLYGTQIDKITRGDIRDVLLKLYRGGSSKSSIGLIHTVASGVFQHALDDELIETVPTTAILRRLDIKQDKKTVEPFTDEQFKLILSVVAYRDFFEVAFQTGARVGELCALQWSDVNFLNKKLKIGKTAKDQRINNSTKTHTAREIDISARLLDILTRMNIEDKKLCFKLGIAQNHVFHDHGKLMSQNTLRRKLAAACKKIGIPPHTVHDIRHTTASILLSRGVPLAYVSRLLGHSSQTVTLNQYSHYMPSENQGMIETLNDAKEDKVLTI